MSAAPVALSTLRFAGRDYTLRFHAIRSARNTHDVHAILGSYPDLFFAIGCTCFAGVAKLSVRHRRCSTQGSPLLPLES